MGGLRVLVLPFLVVGYEGGCHLQNRRGVLVKLLHNFSKMCFNVFLLPAWQKKAGIILSPPELSPTPLRLNASNIVHYIQWHPLNRIVGDIQWYYVL